MKTALAFCGGGGKGSFQIGVWKALRERSMATAFQAVSGTSVGALNAVLFALGDYDLAEKIWRSIDDNKFLSPSMYGESGLYSRSGLRKILDEVDLSRLDNTKIDVFVTTYNNCKGKNEYHKINCMPTDEKRDILLASSAMRIAYPRVKIGDCHHSDGGSRRVGNVPIEALYENGYNDIWIIALERDFNIYNLTETALIKVPSKRIDITRKYLDCRFEIIKPLRNLGGLFDGILDFSENGIIGRLNAGYEDTVKILSNEDVCRNSLDDIYWAIRRKMLSLFKSKQELLDFIDRADFSNLNWDVKTKGGKSIWTNIVEIDGWVVQHKWKSPHCRILDHQKVRKAWTRKPARLLDALELYEAKFR
jgi:NTE family protein